jgi:NADP-dependent 3-hydroxy acid dehydrogenase YdfG
VVITGASSGVGRATAREFARRGARIGLIARDRERLELALREVEALGGNGLVLPLDVADAAAVDAAVEQVEAAFGPLDIWVNNAMTSVLSPVHQLQADEVRRVTEVTYLGCVHGTLAALKRMRPRDRGTIVQVGSALAFRSIPLQAAYCGAKHAIEGFTDSLRTELLHDRSRLQVTSVHLPALNTPQFSWVRSRLPRKPQPVPPIFQPEVAARAIVWAALHPRRQVLVGSPTVAAVYGQRIAPGLLDGYLARTGYDSQQTPEPADPGRPDNLFTSVPGEFGAHGEFDARAKSFSLQFNLAYRAGRWLIGVGIGVGVVSALWSQNRSRTTSSRIWRRAA